MRTYLPTLLLILLATLPTAALGQEAGEEKRPVDDGAVVRPEGVTVKRIRPQDLPRPEELQVIPGALTQGGRMLPRHHTAADLEALSGALGSRVVKIVALRVPPQPYRQVPMLHEGYAVWVSPRDDGGAPVLLSTMDWLEGARLVLIVPPEVSRAIDGAPGKSRSMKSATAGGRAAQLLAHRQEMIAAGQRRPDRHRNLVILEPIEEAPDLAPSTGLVLFPSQREPLTHLYGHAPDAANGLRPLSLLQTPSDDDPALAFYARTTQATILGAPIVDLRGRLVLLGALAHPQDPARTLCVPLGAIEAYLARELEPKDDQAAATGKRDAADR